MRRGQLRGVVAMDGPSGTGKSTVARRLASTLGAGYLDTGAMYRAATLSVLRARVDVTDAEMTATVVERMRLEISDEPGVAAVHLDGEDVAVEIRGPEVTTAVSAVSAVPRVRELLCDQQRAIIERVLDDRGGIVVEGRDIGTVVAPDAELKVYLTASPDARARRRATQDGRLSTVDAVLADVERRDRLDSSRAAAPLRRADDAIELDTTALDVDGVLAALLSNVDERGMRVTEETTRR
ncbi:cytidylate kinase [Herbihabitans rhizosphaerae]|uniref:Cytidylate kinase n=1 Tax=Herbihabitans rhizosphaerae TaxID=1872711 RepID=A0A4Q7L6B6_9PSEU|nr:(d)CMP kinase [Herbihabitans rhizosphaerae]RZS43832.1 cytidylate kinase [Herbihabitans rhizosphaerae]